MSLTFCYIPPSVEKEEDDDDKDCDYLEIKTENGYAKIGELAQVTPGDVGSNIVKSLSQLLLAFQEDKDAVGGAHIYNGGLDWKFDSKSNSFSVRTSIFICETSVIYVFPDAKEKEKTIQQIKNVLDLLVPFVKANTEAIRKKNVNGRRKVKNENTSTHSHSSGHVE